MTNVKASGSDSPSALELGKVHAQIVELRQNVALLRTRLQTTPLQSVRRTRHPWLRAIVTSATTYALGLVARRMGLGAVGVAVLPFIAARVVSNRW